MNYKNNETFDPIIIWGYSLKKSGYEAINHYFNLLINNLPKSYNITEINIYENDYNGNFNEYHLIKNSLEIKYTNNRKLIKTEHKNIKDVLSKAKNLMKEKKVVRFNIKLNIALKNNIKIEHIEFRMTSINTKYEKSTNFFININNHDFFLKKLPKKEYINLNLIIKKFKTEIIEYYAPESGINNINIKDFKNIDEFGFKDSFFN
jgi:hypothetical protein